MSQAGQINEVTAPDVATHFVTDSGTAIPALNTLNILGGTDITTSASGDQIIISFTGGGGGFVWHQISSLAPPTAIVAGNGYIAIGGGTCIFTLPLLAAVGDTFIITGYSALFTIQQHANQSLYLGIQSSTPGVFGSVTSTDITDHLTVVCVVADRVFKIIYAVGNPTFT